MCDHMQKIYDGANEFGGRRYVVASLGEVEERR
jgi:hypothetical protein